MIPSDSRPISVNVCLFTALDPFNPARPAPSNTHPNLEVLDDFGMGLWVVTRRSNEDGANQGTWDERRVLPASLVRSHESLRNTAERIIAEELGIEVSYKLHQNRIFDDIDLASSARVVTVNFWAFVHIEALSRVMGGRDQVGLEMVSTTAFLSEWEETTGLGDYDGVSRFGLRWAQSSPRAHQKQTAEELWGLPILEGNCDEMVFYAWRDLRYGFSGRFDPFRFIGSEALDSGFRLSELRELYEVMRGEKIQPDQFRRMVTGPSGFVEQGGHVQATRSRPGKPAALYTLQSWAKPKSGYRP